MKVVIFGATGGIGKWALKYALEKGNEVTAFVRSPQKVKEQRDRWAVATIVPLLAGLTFLCTGHNEFVAYHRMYVEAGLAWTIVRFCGPTDKPFNPDYKIGFGEKHLGMMIPRENIGAFMVEQLESNEYQHSMPIIGS